MEYSFDDIVIHSRTGLNPRQNFVLGDGDCYYVTIKDIKNDRIIFSKKTDKIDEYALAIINRRSQLKKGDILFSSIGRIGDTAIVEEEPKKWNINESVFAFTLNNKIMINEYFCWIFKSPRMREWLNTNSSGSTFKSIKMNQLKRLKFYVPTLEEQESIIRQLNLLNSLILKNKEIINELNELAKSQFIEMFGNPKTNSLGLPTQRFDTISDNLDYRRRPITAKDRKEGIYPYYGASGIVDYVEDYIFDEDILLISEDGANLVMRSTPIAFSVSGKVWVNNHAHVVKFENFATQKYIEYYFEQIDLDEYITGSAQPKFNQAKLNGMLIPIPTIELQNKFAAFVQQIDKSKFLIQKQINLLEELLENKMNEYFR